VVQVIIQQSQDDGGDEVVWKVSPTAERLQSTANGGSLSRALGEGRSVLQPFDMNCEPVLDILSKTSSRSNLKKKVRKLGKSLVQPTLIQLANQFVHGSPMH
jgi:hypothetical protein